MGFRIRRRLASFGGPPPSSGLHWSVVAWPLVGALGALLLLSLIVWGASASATARLRADLLRARQSLEAIPTPLPEVRNLSGQLDLATAERDALHEFVASTAGENHDWDNILGALLDHDTGRIALRTLYHNGVLLNVSGLALTREDVTAYEERLARSGAFEQVTIQAMEDISAPFPGGPAVPATAIIPPGTPLPTIQDRFEIDDFAPGAITPNEVQQHNFSPVADIDQVTFVGQAGQRYCVLALPQVAGVDPTLDVFVDGTTYSNNNCTSQTMPLVSCLCPTGSVGAPLAALVEFQITPSGSRTVQIRVRNQGSYGPDMWYLLSVSAQGQPATAVVGDIYEPDDVTPRALVLLEQQQHTFFPAGDVDWVAFGVRAGRTYDIRTFNLAPGVDTGLSVDVGGLNFANDNAAPADPSSRVTFVSPVDGQATVVITNRGLFGADKMYWITAVEVGVAPTASPVSPSPAPISCNDPYEPDDTVDRLIAPGEQQQRTFCPGGDVDRVRFLALANHRYRVQTAGLAPGVDTVLNVSMGATTLTNDDRSAGDPASLIEFTNTSGVDQAATVTISNKGAFGAERIAVIRVDDLGSESPDAYEPDIPNKRLISIGEVQRHNFYPSGDIDRLVLVTKAGRRYAVMTCGNAYDPALGGSCQPLAPGVDTVLVTTGAVANCAPAGCQNDDVSPGTSHRGSRVEFDSPSNAEVTLSIYNNGSFGPGQEYYIRADEIGVIPTTSTPTTTTAPSPLPSQTFTPLPSLTFTPIPSSTFTPPPTPSPTDTPTAPPSVTPTMTATPTATGASRMRDGPSLTRPPDVDMTERTLTQGAGVRRWGLQAPDRQGTTIVRFVLSCRIRDTAP